MDVSLTGRQDPHTFRAKPLPVISAVVASTVYLSLHVDRTMLILLWRVRMWTLRVSKVHLRNGLIW